MVDVFFLSLTGYDGALHYRMFPGTPDSSTLPETRTIETELTTGKLMHCTAFFISTHFNLNDTVHKIHLFQN